MYQYWLKKCNFSQYNLYHSAYFNLQNVIRINVCSHYKNKSKRYVLIRKICFIHKKMLIVLETQCLICFVKLCFCRLRVWLKRLFFKYLSNIKIRKNNKFLINISAIYYCQIKNHWYKVISLILKCQRHVCTPYD